MKSIKKTLGIVLTAAAVVTAGSIFVSVAGNHYSDKIRIKMAHNQSKDSEIADCIAKVAEFAAEDPSMNMEIDIYPSGVLGTEQSAVEMVKAGVLDMAKVSSSMLGQFNDCYSIFSLPYLFTSEGHYYNAMEKSEKVRELFRMNEDEGFLVIGYYANGSRNIYLKEDIKADSPAVLKGKKIRSMTSSTSMRMLELMGASPTPMAASETYTALQQGVVAVSYTHLDVYKRQTLLYENQQKVYTLFIFNLYIFYNFRLYKIKGRPLTSLPSQYTPVSQLI